MKHIRFTKEGLENLKNELTKLQAERKPAVLDLKKAREMGDLSENGYYKAARAKLSSIDHRLRHISYQLKQAIIIDDAPSDSVSIGRKVTLVLDGKEVNYQIVGDTEANPSEHKISLNAPLGKALENKKIGDTIELTLPIGQLKYTIKKIV